MTYFSSIDELLRLLFFGGRPQFTLQFFNCRQASLQLFWEAFGEPVFGYADGLVDIAERVFGDKPVVRLAKDEADAGLVVGMPQKVVDRREIEVHLAGELRLERFHLQIDHDVSTDLQVVEEEVDVELLVATASRYWLPTNANPTPSSRRNWRRW